MVAKRNNPITSFEEPIDEPNRNPYSGRILGFSIVFILAFLILSVSLYRLQILEGHQYRDLADNNRYRLVRIDPARGIIYDRNGILLVRNVPSYAVSIVPADLPNKDAETVFAKLAFLLGKSPQQIADLVLLPPHGKRQSDAFTPIEIESDIPYEIAFTIEERHLELPGVIVSAKSNREYLDGNLTSHVIGYVGAISSEQYNKIKNNNPNKYSISDRLGQTGVEYVYETILRGKVGEKHIEVDSSGREIRTLAVEPAVPGNNLKLTIDLDLQREINKIASKDLDKYGSVTIVAMYPKDGEILAMVSLPTYDNNIFIGKPNEKEIEKLLRDPERPLVNHAISDVYPPGSTFKIITAAAALEEGIVKPSQQIECQGAIYVESEYARTRFVCWAVHGLQDIISGLANSCDIYFYHLGGGPPKGEWRGLGVEGLSRWAKLFGLGQPTGVDLPGEAAGIVPNAQWKRENWNQDWFLGDTYNMSIGQGFVTATPLQILNMFTASINGGYLYRPQIVKEVLDPAGRVVKPYTSDLIRKIPVSDENLAYIKRGLRANLEYQGKTPWGTSYVGTAWNAEIPGLNAGGKTGTAEFGNPDPSGKMPTHGWFVATAPLDDPEIAVVVFVEYGSGSQDAAELAEKVLRYYFRMPEEDKK